MLQITTKRDIFSLESYSPLAWRSCVRARRSANSVRPGREQPPWNTFCDTDCRIARVSDETVMSYLVLARKYRPSTFAEVAGQDHVTRTLANGIKRDKVGHAFLFSGPRGVGKTSVARVFSKALNCENGPTTEPCGKCSACKEITQGSSLAVREIDGASHNSVDNVRELIDHFRALPPPGYRYKIYIIDEVHMLSTAAFNALLKSLEEPPPHTVFILATTEFHKIPETVVSRCQRHDFRSLHADEIERSLRSIAAKEDLKVEDGVYRLISRLSDGSMRDAQVLLDRIQLFCDGAITVKETAKLLGAVEQRLLFNLSHSIFTRDATQALLFLDESFSTGVDTSLFIRDFVTHWRELLLARHVGEKGLTSLGIGSDDAVELCRQSGLVSGRDLQDLSAKAREGGDGALRSQFPKYALESLVVRMALREPVAELQDLIREIKSDVPSEKKAPRFEKGKASDAVSRPSNVALSNMALEHAPVGKGTLDWGGFVRHASNSGAKFIAEQLKRLSVDEFSEGKLVAKGPEFSVSYLEKPTEKKRLDSLLQEFTKIPSWIISLKSGAQGEPVEKGSLLFEEREKSVRSERARKEKIVSHPAVQTIQKMFPGSSIEHIRDPEEDLEDTI